MIIYKVDSENRVAPLVCVYEVHELNCEEKCTFQQKERTRATVSVCAECSLDMMKTALSPVIVPYLQTTHRCTTQAVSHPQSALCCRRI